MIENNQYYESTIKTSRINNKVIKINKSVLQLSYGNFVSLEDYLDLYKQLEENQKIIDEIKKYLNNFDTKSLEEQGLGIEVKEFIIKPLEILERGKDE